MRWICIVAVCLLLLVNRAIAQSEKDIATIADRLKKIGDSLKRPETMQQDVEKHLDNLRILKALRNDLETIKKTHGNSMRTSRGQGPFHQLDIAWNYADQTLREYERYAGLVASVEAVTQELDGALRLAKMAVENQAPAFFKPDNSLHQHLRQARLKLNALEAYDPQATTITPLRQQLDSTVKQINEIQAGMKDAILKGNELPADGYRQADREKLLKLINDKWSQEGNGKAVLKVGIINGEWTRKTYWQKVGSDWHLNDLSWLQGYVVVQHDGQTAVRHSINLVKDHQTQDRLNSSWLNDPKREPELVNLLLLSKVK